MLLHIKKAIFNLFTDHRRQRTPRPDRRGWQQSGRRGRSQASPEGTLRDDGHVRLGMRVCRVLCQG